MRPSAPRDYLPQYSDHPLRLQRGYSTYETVVSCVGRLAHEIHGLHYIRLRDYREGLVQPGRQSRLRLPD